MAATFVVYDGLTYKNETNPETLEFSYGYKMQTARRDDDIVSFFVSYLLINIAFVNPMSPALNNIYNCISFVYFKKIFDANEN